MHLLAILWKNGIIRLFRHKTLLAFLLILPAVLFFFIAYARSKLEGFGKDYINETTYSEQTPAQHFLNQFGGNNKLIYVPKTQFTEDLIRQVQLRFEIPNSDVEGLQTEDELMKYYERNKNDDYTILGVVFPEANNFPKSLKYHLRTYAKDVDYKTNKLFNSQIQYTNGVGSDRYRYSGLLSLQLAIDMAYINLAKRNRTIEDRELPELVFQEFPYPPYLNDHGLNELFAHVLPLATLFSFILICPDLLKRLVEEKSTGIKELMKMMGMSTLFQWTGWFVSSFLMSLVSIVLIVFLMKAPIWHDKYAPIEYCSWTIYATFLTLYCLASISKCFLLSTFFHKPSIVIVFGIFAWLLSFIIPVSLTNDETASFCSKILLMLLPNMCLYYGYKTIATFELREIGIQWNTIASAPDGDINDIQMKHVFIMLIFDSIFYIILALYLDTVNPGPYGIKKPFSFPLSYIKNMLKWKSIGIGTNDSNGSSLAEETKILEEMDVDNSRVGIRVENLRKVYDNNVVAVNRLNVKFLKGEITALLGHNGAGKTTTLSIITGIINRTSGRVIINGIDISDNISAARRSMGICTQHNLFFQDLTVLEHLTFFGMVKGQRYRVAKANARKLLQELHLENKSDALPTTLSGGMQRKLCLGIALCGNPEVLILDEPTSGMDVQTRRFIWDKLLERRRLNPDCTTVVSTHFMEEAEVIGDRIAIMNRGELSCYGTLTFLKHNFDTGYRLRLTYIHPEVADEQSRDEIDSVVVSRSNKELRSSLAVLLDDFNLVVEVVDANSRFMECKMPIETEDRQRFLQFLKYLEQDKERLNIGTINITNINLEDIYLKHLSTEKIAKFTDYADGKNRNASLQNDACSSSIEEMEVGAKFANDNNRERIHYTMILWRKRWDVFRNTLPTTLIQCIPSLLLVTVLMFLMVKSYGNKEVSFKMFNYDLTAYGKTSVYYGYNNANKLSGLVSYYREMVRQEGSIPIQAESVSNAIVQAGNENIVYYKRRMVVAAEFNASAPNVGRDSVNIMYSNGAIHGAPIALNLITNSLIKWLIGPEYSIQSANFPLPGQSMESADIVAYAQQVVLFILLFPIAIFTFLCTFLSTPWQDLSSRMKHLQHMSGLTERQYWGSLWSFDLLVCAAVFALLVFFFMGTLFGVTGYVDWMGSGSAMGILYLILMTYAIASLPLAYIMSHMQTMPAAVNAFLISGLFSGFVPTIIVYVMEESNDEPYVEIAGYIGTILSFWPQFGICYACLKYILKTLWIYNWNIKTDAAKKITCHYDYNPCCGGNNTHECNRYKNYLIGNDEAFGNTIIYMLLSAAIYFLILIYHKRITSCIVDCCNNFKKKSKPTKSYESLNEDELKSRNIQFKVNDVSKEFNNKPAVNGLTFEVRKKSLFGILGVNGAGKSTTFKILAGIEKPSRGTAEVIKQKSFTLQHGSEYTKNLGYCPQEDFIVDSLTGRQILNLFGRLRGIPRIRVDQIIKRIGIEEHADKCCGFYSGGTKRKLCLGIAVLGNLPILLLDEPTTGVDPKSKRDIWDLLMSVQADNESSIVLTSHSMDECEALSNRLLIMKEGKSEAENTIPQLKEQYGHMYKVVLKSNPDLTESEMNGHIAIAFIERSVQHACELFDHHGNTYNYHIQKKNVPLSTIFEVMEDLLQQNLVKEYIVHEPTLEDVFLEIAKPSAEGLSHINIQSA